MKRSRESSAEPNLDTRKKPTSVTVQSRLSNVFTFPECSGISKPIEDRSSVFKAFFLPLQDVGQMTKVMTAFKHSRHCDKVDHAMFAYRFPREGGAEPQCGHEDDGERFSGTKLAQLLDSMNAYGLVICIRQYGGIMLGPIRFQHIVQCAREAIMAHRHEASRVKIELEKTRRLLRARDMTIVSLRRALDKQGAEAVLSQASHASDEATRSQEASSIAMTDKYAHHDAETLSRLLMARDKSIQSLRAVLQASKMTTTNDEG